MKKLLYFFCLLLVSTQASAQLNADFTAASTSGCPGETIYFTSTSTGTNGSTVWLWDFGDFSSSSNANSASRVYSAPGSYTVKLTLRNGSTTDVETKTAFITIRDTPLVDFTASPLIGCSPLSVGFTNNTNNQATTTFNWYLGGGAAPGTSTAAAPSVVYTSGPNTITLVARNSFGCFGRKTRSAYVNINPLPAVAFTATPADFCSSPATATFTATSGSTGPYTFDWYFGDGNKAINGGSPVTNTYIGSPGSSFSPKLVVTDGLGCKDSLTKNSYINIHNVSVSISSNSSVCEGSPIIFTGMGLPAGGTYSWSFGGSVASPATYFYSPGGKTVTVTYTYKGCSATATKAITVHPKPVADFVIDPDTLCPAPVTTQFIANASYDSYTWDFGDFSGTSNLASPTHTYLGNGFYTPKLIVSTANGCLDTVVKTDYVKVYDLLLEDTSNINKGCAPLTVRFYDSIHTSIPSPPIGRKPYPYPIKTFYWDFGDGGTSSLQTPVHTFLLPGTYKVWHRIETEAGCIKVDTMIIVVGEKPIADFVASDTRICNNNCVQFTDLTIGNVDSWKWSFGDMNSSTAANPSHCYMVPGFYTVSLIVADRGCTDTVIKTNYITVDSPWALMTYRPSCDTPTKLYFKNESQGYTWHKWYFGDGQESTDMDPVHQYASVGFYDAFIATYNDRSGCRDTFRARIEVSDPQVTLSADKYAICQDGKVRFRAGLSVASRAIVSYEWFVDNAKKGDSLEYFTYKFTATGNYKIKVVVTDVYGCVDSIVKVDYIFVSKPTVDFTAAPTSGCVPITVNFTDNSTVPTGATIASRAWAFGNGNATATSASISRTYFTKGEFSVKLIVTDNLGCKDSMTKVKYIQANKPIASFSIDDTVCANTEVIFTNSSVDFDTSLWDFGDGKTSADTDPKHTYTAPGQYTISLIVTDNGGCKDTVVLPNAVTVIKPIADIALSDTFAVCAPLDVAYTNRTSSTGGYKWAWDFGNGNTSTQKSPKNQVYITPGYFTITMTVTDNFGCTDTDTAHVSILGYAGAFSYDKVAGCSPLEVNFDASNLNVTTMTWDFSDGTTIKTSSNKISHIYKTPGAYIPKLVVEGQSGCRAISPGLDTIKVDAVIADFYPDAPCQYSNVTFIDTSKSYFTEKKFWQWTFHDGQTSTTKNPVKMYGPAGTYPVKLFVENKQGCKDSITKDVTIYPPPSISAGADTTVCLTDSATLMASGGVSYLWNTTPYLSCLDCATPYASPKEAFRFVVTGKDEHNCTNTDTVLVNIKTKASAVASTDKEICRQDSVQLVVSGAKTYTWTPSEGLSNRYSATPMASPYNTTKYMVVSYEGKCIPDTDFVNVTVHPLPTVKATGEATIIAGNSTNIQATGTLISRFEWTPRESLNCADCPAPVASPNRTTNYVVRVYTDKGCVDSDIVRVTVLCDKSQLFIPNTFTPNGDGQNDVFYPRGNGLDKVRSFRIYNRWGEMVFERTGITINDANVGWDGTYKGQVLPPDVFVYVVDAICEDGQTISWKGDVTIVR